ncbi:MAG: alanine--tRNA ligase-related protein [Patescibacteria group bacterium]|nr:alanine--tRNA ligase-related protein [Patescibacteria group bacterium]
MTARELIEKYISFFEARGHVEIAGASLVPENDPSALFISAGMHPLIPFLLGEEHPAGKRLVSLQKCIRTNDIEQVGDGFHHTFFLMLGNWSLGDYFKKEAISFSFEFLTSSEWLGLAPERLYVSVFAGDETASRDKESIKYWKLEFKKVGIKAEVGERIFFFGKEENWWGPVGDTGPCGPDTEIFYDIGKDHCGPNCDPSCQCGKYIEIWNDVFMEFKRIRRLADRKPQTVNREPQDKERKAESGSRNADYEYVPLEQKNVDTGMGVARVVAVTSGYADDDYKTDLFHPIISKIEDLSGKEYQQLEVNNEQSLVSSMRIIADHVRAAVFAISDGVVPSNTDRGYVVRRLIRRAVRHGHALNIQDSFLGQVAEVVIENYKDLFPGLESEEETILTEISDEEKRFGKVLRRGLKHFEKLVEQKVGDETLPHLPAGKAGSPAPGAAAKEAPGASPALGERITGEEAFDLYQTYGFPLELTKELAEERGLAVDRKGFEEAYKKHQEKSRSGADKKFSGGLVSESEEVIKLHTATHLLHEALRQVLGAHVKQEGSNITPQRLRFDFSHPKAMTEEEIGEVEALVNEKIEEDLPVRKETMSLEEARERGALAFFTDKYGDEVKVYSIGGFSKEVCAGPHVDSTGKLGKFEIIKEESVGRGKRRIRAILKKD